MATKSNTTNVALNAIVNNPLRKVTVYVTSTKQKESVETRATTWGELKAELSSTKNLNTNGYKILEGRAGVQLVNDDTQLPTNIRTSEGLTNDLMIFVSPAQKIKSGMSMTRNEAYAYIKEAIAKDGEAAKAHFNVGKNYTTKKTDELESLITSYSYKASKKTTSGKCSTAKAFSKEKEAPKEAKEANVAISSASLEMIKEGIENILKGVNTLDESGIISLTVSMDSSNMSTSELDAWSKKLGC